MAPVKTAMSLVGTCFTGIKDIKKRDAQAPLPKSQLKREDKMKTRDEFSRFCGARKIELASAKRLALEGLR